MRRLLLGGIGDCWRGMRGLYGVRGRCPLCVFLWFAVVFDERERANGSEWLVSWTLFDIPGSAVVHPPRNSLLHRLLVVHPLSKNYLSSSPELHDNRNVGRIEARRHGAPSEALAYE